MQVIYLYSFSQDFSEVLKINLSLPTLEAVVKWAFCLLFPLIYRASEVPYGKMAFMWRKRGHIVSHGSMCRNFKGFSKKFVIACHRAHIYKWLNLLPEPKRNLQRFGFVHLWGLFYLTIIPPKCYNIRRHER